MLGSFKTVTKRASQRFYSVISTTKPENLGPDWQKAFVNSVTNIEKEYPEGELIDIKGGVHTSTTTGLECLSVTAYKKKADGSRGSRAWSAHIHADSTVTFSAKRTVVTQNTTTSK